MTHIIRASERSAFQRCQKQWEWRYRWGLVPRREKYDARWFGTGIHLALARWYTGPGTKRGIEPAETWQAFAGEALAYVKTLFDSGDEERIARYEEAGALGTAMCEGYRALYGRDDHISVIQAEQTFRLDIPWPEQGLYTVDLGEIIAIHVGTWDLAYRNLKTGDLWLEEHKTAAQIQTRHLPLDNQGGTYWAVATAALRSAKLIKTTESLKGIQYNFLRKGLPDTRPLDAQGYATNKPLRADYISTLNAEIVNPKCTLAQLEEMAKEAGVTVLGERSKSQPPPLFLRYDVHRTAPEQKNQLERIQDEALHMRVVRDGLLPMTKSPTRDCNFCDFYDICELQERGGDWEFLRDSTFRSEDPYADHRKSAGE